MFNLIEYLSPVKAMDSKKKPLVKAAGGMMVGDITLFDSKLEGKELEELWEVEYKRVMNKKYAKGGRNFTRIKGKKELKKEYGSNPPIFLIPRQRGGPSYKDVDLEGAEVEDVVFCAISKGYGMQDVSSFSLGPIANEGLCVVNAAFSKGIYAFHIEGGGVVDYNRKTFWKKSKKPLRKVRILQEDGKVEIDGEKHSSEKWLNDNKEKWFPEWQKWSRSVALASVGNFHWDNDELAVGFWDNGKYLDFITWKKKCYVEPAYPLIKETKVFKYLVSLREKGYPLGLVHPKARKGEKEKAITKEFIRELYDSPYEMACMPYCVAGVLMGVEV